MFTRRLELPRRSFFLFGPRATGKSTWLRRHFDDALYLDFLRNDVLHRFLTAPEQLRSEVLAQPREKWVVLDEVQRVPALLNEVHALMEEFGYHFALSGSSARQLKRRGANLLAGRASVKHLYPLTRSEYGSSVLVEEVLRFGTLPLVLDDVAARVEILEAYAGTYLRQEIKEEAATRRIDAFARFLEITAIANAQVTNLSGIARDASVARSTVETYFEILEDTFLGHRLPAWKPSLRVKEVSHPKFYLFDTGVTRALQGRLRDAPTAEELGHLLETYLCHELRAHIEYAGTGGLLSYWRTPQGVEVDFIWSRGKYVVAVEVKATKRWRVEYDKALKALGDALPSARRFAVYLGDVPLKRAWGEVLPLPAFLERLTAGEIIG